MQEVTSGSDGLTHSRHDCGHYGVGGQSKKKGKNSNKKNP